MDLQEKARRKLQEKLGLPPQAVGMDGNELLDRLNRLSRVQTIKDIPAADNSAFSRYPLPSDGRCYDCRRY